MVLVLNHFHLHKDTYFLILDIKVIKSDEKYYLRNMWDAEENIVNRITSLNNKKAGL